MKPAKKNHIPIIDLFAGPGGLGEGFSSFENGKSFKIGLSIEKEPFAHQTLTLRAFYRQFSPKRVPAAYYDYLRGELSKDELFKKFPSQAEAAKDEARLMTLGEDDPNPLIAQRIKGHKHWVLIGGPPCQAYSLVGRSKILGTIKKNSDESEAEYEARRASEFSADPRHQLYLEYLDIISKHWPSIFIMENVRGILSSKLNGELIFPRILADLSDPSKSRSVGGKRQHTYRIFSLTTASSGKIDELQPADFLIHSEKYGIPQARHRVILVGVRDDLGISAIPQLKESKQRTAKKVLNDLPKLTPGLSKKTEQTPYESLQEAACFSINSGAEASLFEKSSQEEFAKTIRTSRKLENRGSRFIASENRCAIDWYNDSKLGGVCNHETRGHIKEDLWRYAFSAWYAKTFGPSPQLRNFPTAFLPKHRNVNEAISGKKFGDRFRVQVADKPATTVTSHISKDGHYFIHYDPSQYRSLTVREAARLQTFPDNYFFEGPRTAQYQQVGNAVPPLLAYQIAEIVAGLINRIEE